MARVGYGLGSMATGTFAAVPGLLLLYYLTEELAVPAALAGFIVFMPKAWDVIANPIVGHLSDRLGKRRPFLLAGAAVLPVSFALMFAQPSVSPGWAALYVGAFYLVAATGYALYQVPYIALAAEITDDYHERSTLMAYRMAFLGVAILVSGAVAPTLAESAGYPVMGMVIGVVILIGILSAYAGTRGVPIKPVAHSSMREQLSLVARDRPFKALFAVLVLQAIAAGLMLAAVPYNATYILDDPKAVTLVFLCLIGPLIPSMPLWTKLARRLDKRGALLLASALFSAGGLLLSLTREMPGWWPFLCTAIIGLGYAGMQMLPFSMVADVIAADAVRSGHNRGGAFTGVWTAGETLALAAGPALFGQLLGLAGFVSSDPDTKVAQPSGAIDAILYGGTLVPAAFMLLSLPFLKAYRLTEADTVPGQRLTPR